MSCRAPSGLRIAPPSLFLLFALLAPLPLTAQQPDLSLHVGVSQWDLSGTGTDVSAALRARFGLNSVLSIEAGLGATVLARASTGADEGSWLFTPEVQLQVAAPGRVSPYVGVGVGLAHETSRASADSETRTAASVSAGVRLSLSDRFSLVPELRVRGIGDSFQGSTAEWTLGLNLGPGG